MKKIMVLIIVMGMSFIYLTPALYGQEPPLCDGQAATIWGTEGHNIIYGTDGPDIIHGLGGFDIIMGLGGDDVICGGGDNDSIDGGEGNDIIFGEGGNDYLLGGSGDDILHGGNGIDHLDGKDGNDKLYGDNHPDVLVGGPGEDELYGGSGNYDNDTCYDESGTLIENCEGPNFAAVPRTGQTKSYAPGDDGDWQMGMKWPAPRFTDHGDGTVTDRLTGLIWLKNANCFGEKNWYDALDASNNLADGDCGLSDGSSPGDWRLPNVKELQSLIDYGRYSGIPLGHPFTGLQPNRYWSGTTLDKNGTNKAWYVYIYHGHTHHSIKGNNSRSVWPVRGGN